MSRRRLAAVLAVLGLAACAPSAPAVPAPSPTPSSSPPPAAAPAAPAAQADPWEPELAAFDAQDREHPFAPGGVVFAGSSSIRMWTDLAEDFPDVRVLNRGFGGSQMSDLLQHLDRVVLRYRPRLVMVYEGDNDLAAGKTPEQVLADYRAVVQRIHQALPETRIGFLAVKPSPSRWELEDRMKRTNELVAQYSGSDPLLFYVDVHTPLLGPDGQPRPELYREDRLHMTRAGYEIWKRVVAPYLE